ncbi:hypothetical protein UREOM_2980 [Ureaplasma sp. OM1]|uniref:Serine aminopeptidase S33 domain-containing protein n=2 Tax=Ureaplasma ceti TaxID=3119530 RepID=A0ABP9U931_9BACT
MRICEFIKRDCDKVLIAETEDKEIVGTIFFSSKFSKKSLLTAKAEINERTGIETRTMFNNLINIRNLANIYKFELNERKQKYVFVDYILVNPKYNEQEVKQFLRQQFIDEIVYDGHQDFFIMNINNTFFNFFKDLNWHIVDRQYATHTYFKVFFEMQLIHAKLHTSLDEEILYKNDNYVNIFSDHIELDKIYHQSYPAYNQDCTERILLIHGTASSHQTWNELIPILRNIANIEVVDMPLHGDSNNEHYNKYRWDILSLSLFMAAFIKKQGWDNLILWGHSLGGGVAVNLKELIPNKIKGLILEDPYNSGALENSTKLIGYTLKLSTSSMRKRPAKQSNLTAQEKWNFAMNSYKPFTKYVVFFLISLLSKQIMNYLDWAYYNNNSPTLVCFGEEDVVLNPTLSKRFFDRFNSHHYTFVEIPSSGHSLHHDNPVKLLTCVFNFLHEKFGIEVESGFHELYKIA